ncbi:hypothetical protein Gotur_010677 [Gossypium turneri]
MHLSIAQMGSKSDEFPDETDHVAVGSQYSINEDKTGDSLYHRPSEASNLLSVNSSHDSYSESIESKATARPSDVANAMVDVGIDRTFSNKSDGSKGVESHVDSISCPGRASDANIAFSYSNKDLDSKNSSRSATSVCSLGSGKAPTSEKLELSEPASVKEGSSSPRIQTPYSHSGSSKSAVGGSSEISPKIHPKLEADIDDNGRDPLDKTGKNLKEDELDELNEFVKLPDKQESPSQTASVDESFESDASEHDVKVCDICGDAGREDLLAICSKCTDGAEHTYCMREMLQKVPEGDWLCEECKLGEGTESQKQGLDAEGKKANKLSSSTRSLGKRHAENLEGASAPKRQAIQTNMGSPKSLSPSRLSAFSREGSFKNLDKGKVRPSPQISLGNHSGNGMPEAVRTPPSGPRLQTSKGSLLKCSSFNTLNSKPKVKLVDEVVIQKRKGAREHASFDSKEEPARSMGKSMSFKSGNSGRLNSGESKLKTLSSKYPHVQDLKGLKQVKEQISSERKNISKLNHSSSSVSTPKVDQKLTPRADEISHSSAINHRETKVVQSEGRPNTLSRSTSNLARKGVDNAVSSVVSSTNGRNSSEQKVNPVSLKEEPSSSSSRASERQPSNNNGVMSDGLSQSVDSINQSEKSRESSVSRSSKRVPCLTCKGMGHTAEYCSVCQASGADQSAPRTSREEINKGNKLKAAIEAAMRLKPGICERTSQDPSSVCDKAKNVISVESTDEGKTNICNQASTANIKLLNSHSTDAVSVVSSVGNLSVRDNYVPPLATVSAVPKLSAIPEHEYIWQGAFDVNKLGKPPELCGGIQAHISTLASPKVLEAVNSFPHKVSLYEVPRLSTWPAQFHDSSPKEDNIALYFFAKDLESYQNNYKVLLDTMVKNDLALKGNFEGVELLIFPSNHLPEHCQRKDCDTAAAVTYWLLFLLSTIEHVHSMVGLIWVWHFTILFWFDIIDSNATVYRMFLKEHLEYDFKVKIFDILFAGWNNLLFLWGVFKARKANCSNSSKSVCNPDASMVCLEKQRSSDIAQPVDNESAACDSSCNVVPVTTSVEKTCISTDRVGDNKVASFEQTFGGIKEKLEEQDVKVDTKFLSRIATSSTQVQPKMKCTTTLEESKFPDSQSDTELKPCLLVTETNNGSFKVEKVEMHIEEAKPSLNNCPTGKQEAVVEEKIGGDPVKIRDSKLKTGFSGIYQYTSARDQVPFRDDGLASDRHYPGSGSLVEEKRCDIACEEKIIPEDMGSSERFFFPVESRGPGEFRLGDNSKPWKELSLKDEDQVHDTSPNLELALGAETRSPNKGTLPFFVGAMEKNDNRSTPQDKLTKKQEEDDVSASLSLSLSFPFPEMERNVKPVPKPEQQLPERHPVNTSLLLFRGFPEK